MTPEKFQQLALSLPEVSQNEPDFSVQNKVFASLFPTDHWAVVKIVPELQNALVAKDPDSFEACKGAWGRNGATVVSLADADEGDVLRALISAWRKCAPASLVEDFDQNNS